LVLPDVNVLVYAHREDAPQHDAYLDWLQGVINADEAYGLSEFVLSGFVRVATHPKVFKTPSPISDAIAFADQLREQPNCVPVSPGPRHWSIFTRLCLESGVKGNLVPDAFLAALAIESGCEWVSCDRDFSRFKGLRWRHPLDQGSRT
jgi:toxin-antitoxin system PIN domain toxin